MDRLEEMRVTMAQLKEKLDNQTIINDKLMRETMSNKVRRLNYNVWWSGFGTLFVITFGNYMFHNMGLSNWFLLGTTVMMIVCFLATIIPHSRVKQENVLYGDLKQVAVNVRKLKQLYHDWLKIGLPMVGVWFLWLASELYFVTADWKIFLGLIIPMAVGGIVGGLVGNKLKKGVEDTCDQIISQIES